MEISKDVLNDNLDFMHGKITLQGLKSDKEISREFIILKNYEVAHFCLACLQMFELSGVAEVKLLNSKGAVKFVYSNEQYNYGAKFKAQALNSIINVREGETMTLHYGNYDPPSYIFSIVILNMIDGKIIKGGDELEAPFVLKETSSNPFSIQDFFTTKEYNKALKA